MFNNITSLHDMHLKLQIAANSVALSSESINLIYSNLVSIMNSLLIKLISKLISFSNRSNKIII